MDIHLRFYAILYKEDNFYDFLFVHQAPSEKKSNSNRKECSQGEYILFF